MSSSESQQISCEASSRLTPFGPEIWVVEGPVVPFYRMPYPTRMVVIRLSANDTANDSGGGLFVWSPVALDDALKAEVDALGEVRHLVSPNTLHHLYLGEWKTAYPQARLYAPPGLARKRRDLAFDAALVEGSSEDWTGEVDLAVVRGSLFMTEVVFFHHASRTAIFGDLIENFSPRWFSGWRGWLARLDGIVQPNGGAPREWRLSFLNRRAARRALQRILDWKPERVVMAHGEMVHSDGAAFIRHAFRWLLGG